MNYRYLFCIFLGVLGCKPGDSATDPQRDAAVSVSRIDGRTQYTFSVPHSIFGIHDTITASMTATNIGAVPETLGINYGWLLWALKDSTGRTITSGPGVMSSYLMMRVLEPLQSAEIGSMYVPITDTSGRPVIAGTYALQALGYGDWTFASPMSIQISLQ